MVKKTLDTASADIRKAVETLQDGGVILYPTETVYGIGCLTDRPETIERLAVVKGIQRTDPFLVLIRELRQIAAFCVDVPAAAFTLMERFWPGPLTLVMPAAKDVHPRLVGPSSGVALRISSHPWVRSLMEHLDTGLISTSANFRKEPPPNRFSSVDAALLRAVDFAVDTGTLTGRVSTLLDLCTSPPMIRRQGAVQTSEIEKLIGEVQVAGEFDE